MPSTVWAGGKGKGCGCVVVPQQGAARECVRRQPGSGFSSPALAMEAAAVEHGLRCGTRARRAQAPGSRFRERRECGPGPAPGVSLLAARGTPPQSANIIRRPWPAIGLTRLMSSAALASRACCAVSAAPLWVLLPLGWLAMADAATRTCRGWVPVCRHPPGPRWGCALQGAADRRLTWLRDSLLRRTDAGRLTARGPAGGSWRDVRYEPVAPRLHPQSRWPAPPASPCLEGPADRAPWRCATDCI